jgi:Holliday junction resolvasome RuvABC endonuclease subunit
VGLGRNKASRGDALVLKTLNKTQLNKNIIIAIDPASHSLAWVVMDISKPNIISHGKIILTKTQDISVKFDQIYAGLTRLCKEYKPSIAVIEQSVYIQNFQSSRIISYIIGYSWGVLNKYCKTVMDVNPMIWKRNIGYKNLSKEDKSVLDTEIKRKKERKQRVIKIIAKYFDVKEIEDDDITDAIGIGLWYYLSRSDHAS